MQARTSEREVILPTGLEEEQPHRRSFSYGALALFLVALFATLILSVAYKLSDSRVLARYVGFVELEWSDPADCRVLASPSAGYPSMRRVASWYEGRPNAVARCASDWITPKGSYLELEYAGFRSPGSSHPLYFGVERSSREEIAKLYPREGYKFGVWRLTSNFLPDLAPGEQIRIHLVDEDPEAGWVSLRTRANFYSVLPWSLKLRAFGARHKGVLRFALAAAVVGLLLLSLPRTTTAWRVALMTLVLSVVLHFRPDVFFHNDDFFFLERFEQFGWRAIFQNHFDHFMPLFAGTLYLEYLLFKGDYLFYQLSTFALHTVNAVLLWQLLRKLHCPSRLSVLLACVVFAGSWLQLAALQWLTCQSIVLSMTLRLAAYLLALSVIEQGGRMRSFSLLLLMILAPLCFAGGIIIAFEVLLLALLFGTRSSPWFRSVIDATFVAALTSLVLYFVSMYGAELVHQRVSLTDSGDLHGLFWFTVLGSQFGTLLRSIVPLEVSGLVRPLFGLPSFVLPSVIASSAALLLLLVYLRRRDGSWRFWLFGQVLLLAPMFLTGIGRLHWGGIEYALTIRYHSVSLLGACILLIPLGQRLRLRSWWFALFLLVWMNYQLTAVSSVREYVHRGVLDQKYYSQLKEWVAQLRGVPASSFFAEETELAGLFPLPYGGMPFDPHAFRPSDIPYSNFTLLLPEPQDRRTALQLIVDAEVAVP